MSEQRKAYTIMIAMCDGANVWVQNDATREEAWLAAMTKARTMMHPRDGHVITAIYVIDEDEEPLGLPTDRTASQQEINSAIEQAAQRRRHKDGFDRRSRLLAEQADITERRHGRIK